MTIKWRFCDKPLEVNSLVGYEDNKYVAQAKLDGWRCIIIFNENGSIETRSRVNKSLDICSELAEALSKLNVPPNSMLDSEWMARRPGHVGKELIYLFGVLYWNGEWMGQHSERERWELVKNLQVVADPLRLPAYTTTGYEAFYESTKNDPTAEGIVLKDLDSKLLGNLRECKDNPLWYKLKWRGGPSNNTIIKR